MSPPQQTPPLSQESEADLAKQTPPLSQESEADLAKQIWSAATYGDAFADVYDEWYDDQTDIEECVALIATLGGPVLELGIGTGRLALALAATGLEVHGVDASEAMLERLRAKPGSESIALTLADMSCHLPSGPFATVLVAVNTLFNLADSGQQQAAILAAAAVLREGGHLVVEADIPAADEPDTHGRVTVRSVDPGRAVLSVSVPDSTGATLGQFIDISTAGVVLRPWRIRVSTPGQIDAMATVAGLELEQRRARWGDEAFSAASAHHVSVYRKISR
jgi:SAM-dependent methyltransferase